MLLVFPFSHRDKDQAVRLANWMAELGLTGSHDLLLLHNPATTSEGVLEPIKGLFNAIEVVPLADDVTGWPEGPNHMFKRLCQHLAWGNKPRPFLWIEPDAIPLRSNWLDVIEKEYAGCRMPFMGANVMVPTVPEHMSGVAVYPVNPQSYSKYFTVSRYGFDTALRKKQVAWDVATAEDVVYNAYWTKLIQHTWNNPKFESLEDLKQINKETVLFHQNKDGKLIELWRSHLSQSSVVLSKYTGKAKRPYKRGRYIKRRKNLKPDHRAKLEAAGELPKVEP